MDVKKPTTYEEQLKILKSKGLIVEDEKFALKILKELNYYTFTGYLREFKIDEENYEQGTTFEKVYHIIEFDRKLRNILLFAIEPIELLLKSKISYHIAHKYGPLGYLKASNFENGKLQKMIVRNFNRNVNKNKRLNYVAHHINKYDGKFPIWVAVNLFSFGMISNLYENFKEEDKVVIARTFNTYPDQLESFINCIVSLRNVVAHYMRLYNTNLNKTPLMCTKNHKEYKITNKVFDVIYIMKFLSLNKQDWNENVVDSLKKLFEEYKKYINYDRIGFPEHWYSLLVYNIK